MAWPEPQQILDQLGGALILTRPDGVVVYANAQAESRLGVPASALSGAVLWNVLASHLHEPISARDIGDHLAGRKELDRKMPDDSGGYRWVRFQIHPVLAEFGEPCGLQVALHDVTTLQHLRQRCENQNQRLSSLADSVPEAIVAVDANEKLVIYNRAAEKLFGYSRAGLMHQSIQCLPELAKVLCEYRGRPVEFDGSPSPMVRRIQGKRSNGRTFSAEVTISRALEGDCCTDHLVIRDASRVQQMEKALQRTQKTQAIGALARGVAHDFNNVLTAILSHLELLDCSEDMADSLRENLHHARTSAQRGAELVNRLLTFSRQNAAKLAPLSPATVVDEVVAMLYRTLDRRIQIIPELVPEDLWNVHGDSSQLMHVVMNLCLNARDAMPEGGELSIWMENIRIRPADAIPPRRPGDFVKVAVRDSGCGMEQETLDRLFEPYFTTKEFGKGAGLGLSIAQNIVSDHHGWLEVESRPNAGSRFEIYLPRARGTAPSRPATAPAAAATEDPKALEGNETILIVDDEELIRLVGKTVLEYRGYRILEAESGAQALERFRSASGGIDLVLLDLHLPDMDGRVVLQALREVDPEVCMVMMSGGEMEGEEVQGGSPVGYLNKPFENIALARTVRKALDARKPTSSRSSKSP